MKYLLITSLIAMTSLGCDSHGQSETSISDSEFRNAVRNGKAKQVERYLRDGYEINRTGAGGENALQEGVLHYEVAKLLIAKGIDVDRQHKFDGTTPLIVACIAGNIEARTVKLLLDNGADPRIKDAQGKTAIDYAADNATKFPNPKYGFAEKLNLMRASLETPKDTERSGTGQPTTRPDSEGR